MCEERGHQSIVVWIWIKHVRQKVELYILILTLPCVERQNLCQLQCLAAWLRCCGAVLG